MAFDNLRHTYTEWGSGDGAIPVTLSPGRVLWLFGDTFVTAVDGGGSFASTNHIVRNSFVLQENNCFTPIMGGTPLARTDEIPGPAPGEWYWPASAVVEGGALRVFVLHEGNGGNGSLDFHTIDVKIASFALPSLAFQGISDLPFSSAQRPYGSTVMIDGNYVYAYGANNTATQLSDVNAQFVWLARAPLGSVMNSGAWQFSTGSGGWSPSPAAAVRLANFVSMPTYLYAAMSAPAAQLWVVHNPTPSSPNTAYLATAKVLDAFSPDVSLFSAPAPDGPWTYSGAIGDTSWQSGTSQYGAQTFFGLPGTAATTPSVIYSSNLPFGSSRQPSNIYEYGPRFAAPTISPLP